MAHKIYFILKRKKINLCFKFFIYHLDRRTFLSIFPTTVSGSSSAISMTLGNLSSIHIDFMVGSEQLRVDGILKNGDIEPIMNRGEWVFKI